MTKLYCLNNHFKRYFRGPGWQKLGVATPDNQTWTGETSLRFGGPEESTVHRSVFAIFFKLTIDEKVILKKKLLPQDRPGHRYSVQKTFSTSVGNICCEKIVKN